MRRPDHLFARLLPMLAMFAFVAPTRVSSAQSVLANDSLRVELVGLRTWTVPMIQDSLRRYAPAASLLSHACAVALRGIGFADASAPAAPPLTRRGPTAR